MLDHDLGFGRVFFSQIDLDVLALADVTDARNAQAFRMALMGR